MVPIRNDDIFEGLKQFTAQLSIPAGETGVMLGAAVATVDITDDDSESFMQPVMCEFWSHDDWLAEAQKTILIMIIIASQFAKAVSSYLN